MNEVDKRLYMTPMRQWLNKWKSKYHSIWKQKKSNDRRTIKLTCLFIRKIRYNRILMIYFISMVHLVFLSLMYNHIINTYNSIPHLFFISCNKCLFVQILKKKERDYNLTQLHMLLTCRVRKVRIKWSNCPKSFTKKGNVATR